ncbi:uncharacterized protein LOC135330943 isoform X2 [Halichondria panicea]|uniref:uncharacterized protein LOC135330943 isoform X2 n=1 Tax=Halichondria panicea TaxID=6063 RepID=UPI00312B48FF
MDSSPDLSLNHQRRVQTDDGSSRERKSKLPRHSATAIMDHAPSSTLKKRESFREYVDLSVEPSEGKGIIICTRFIRVSLTFMVVVDYGALPKSNEFEDMTQYDFEPKIAPIKRAETGPDSMSGEIEVSEVPNSEDESPGPLMDAKKDSIGHKRKQVTRQLEVRKSENEMMDEHPSYHEEITGDEAEKRLKLCSNHGYLTRHSKKNQSYVLSVHKQTGLEDVFKHFPILFTNGNSKMYQIGVGCKEFANLLEMLNFYERNRIDPSLKSIGTHVTEDEYHRREQERNNPVPLVGKRPKAVRNSDSTRSKSNCVVL